MRLPTRFRIGVVSFVLVIGLTGCGGGGGGTGDGGGGSGSGNNAASVQGGAVKGVISDGTVRVKAITEGGVDPDPIAQTKTNARGEYTVTIDNHSGPVLVEVVATGTSTMRCDFSGGCGQHTAATDNDLDADGAVDFGERHPLPQGFALKAAVPSVDPGDELDVNVTALTHLAAELAYARGPLTSGRIERANGQIANLFQLDSRLPELRSPDITDIGSFRDSTAVQAVYGLVNAAIGAAIQRERYNSQLTSFAEEYAAGDGQLYWSDSPDGSVTVLEIVEAAQALVRDLDVALPTAAIERLNRLKWVAESAPGERTSSQPAPTIGAGAVEKAKDLVGQVREWSFLLVDANDGFAETPMGRQVQAVEGMLDDSTEMLMVRLGRTLEIVVYLVRNQLNGEVNLADVGPAVGIQATGTADSRITLAPLGAEVTIEGVVDGADVSMTIDLALSGESRVEAVYNGVIQMAATRFQIDEGTAWASEQDNDVYGLEAEMDGVLDHSTSGYTFDGTSYFDVNADQNGVGNRSASLQGRVEDANGEGFDASLTAQSLTDDLGDADFTLTVSAEAVGRPGANVSVSGNRRAWEAGTFDLAFASEDGRRINARYAEGSGQSARGVLTVTSPDGTRLVADLDASEEIGEITVDGEKVASIEETDSGPVVRYADGQFESLIPQS